MRRVFASILSAAVLLVATPGSAQATEEAVTAGMGRRALLLGEGAAVAIRVQARCPAGFEVLEAFIYIVQGDQESQFASIPLHCDGSVHRFRIEVPAYEESPFHRGRARASAYVLVEEPETGRTESVSPTRRIRIFRRLP